MIKTQLEEKKRMNNSTKGEKKMENKYLQLARTARAEQNSEDAKKYYDMVRTDDPTNAEAKYFYAYYALYEGANKDIGTRFSTLCNGLSSTILALATSDNSADEKVEILQAICDSFVPLTWTLNRYMNKLTVGSGSNTQHVLPASMIQGVCRNGIMALYNLGDTIAKNLNGALSNAMTCAVACWKEGVLLQQKWYSVVKDKTLPETYASKIKNIEPNYEMPKKAGCISLADKR